MKQKQFKLAFRADGTIDPECIEQAGLRWVKTWLARRLSGDDPFVPLDERVDEDPEALVVGLLRAAGLAHPACSLVSKAILSFLDQSAKRAPDVPPFFSNTLRLCQQVRIPDSSPWFTEQLAQIVNAPVRVEKRWGGVERTKEIVYAGAVQSPGLPSAASKKAWQALLKVPQYATLALAGLCRSFEDQVAHMKSWWRTCPAEERELELNQMLFTALKTESEKAVLAILKSAGESFPPDLKEAVNRSLRENGARIAFSDSVEEQYSREAYWGAITDAAQKPELVLPAA
jgi:hypothetical protein